jgi:hypothetical protein
VRELLRWTLQAGRELARTPRHRWQLAGIILVGAAIPLVELLVLKVFTELITEQVGSVDLRAVIPQVVVFLLLVVAAQAVHYAQRTYRVTFLASVLGSQPPQGSAQRESWQWAQALEVVGILTALTQLAVTAGLFLVLAPAFGLLNVVLLWVLLEGLGRIFARQVEAQRGYVERGRARDPVATHTRVRSRIVSSERATVLAAAGSLVLMLLLLGMAFAGAISPANTIVLFLGLRMQKSTFSTLAGSTVRFARAAAYTA